MLWKQKIFKERDISHHGEDAHKALIAMCILGTTSCCHPDMFCIFLRLTLSALLWPQLSVYSESLCLPLRLLLTIHKENTAPPQKKTLFLEFSCFHRLDSLSLNLSLFSALTLWPDAFLTYRFNWCWVYLDCKNFFPLVVVMQMYNWSLINLSDERATLVFFCNGTYLFCLF